MSFGRSRGLPIEGINFLILSGYYFAKKSLTNIRKVRKIPSKSQKRIVWEKIWEWWVCIPPISMKKCPLSSEVKFFEDYGCLFCQSRWLPIREELFTDTIQFAYFCPIRWERKIFFDFVAGFSLFRCLPIEGDKLESRNLNTTPIIFILSWWLIFAEKVPN